MLHFSPAHLGSLEVTAATAASYLDACDGGARHARLDPVYYQACAALLVTIFGLIDAPKVFPSLLKQSAAARETAESIQIGHHISVSRVVFYPELAALMSRAAM